MMMLSHGVLQLDTLQLSPRPSFGHVVSLVGGRGRESSVRRPQFRQSCMQMGRTSERVCDPSTNLLRKKSRRRHKRIESR